MGLIITRTCTFLPHTVVRQSGSTVAFCFVMHCCTGKAQFRFNNDRTGKNANYSAVLKQSALFLCGLDYCFLFLNVVEQSVTITTYLKYGRTVCYT